MPDLAGSGLSRLQRRIIDWVDDHRADVIDLTQALVRIPSENKPPHGNERDVQRFLADRMRELGCRVDMFRPDEVPGIVDHPAYWPGRDYTDRSNVVGVLGSFDPAGSGTRDRPSLMFSSHADVVPALGHSGRFGWWDAAIDGGRLYGRGSCDMKGGIAAYLTATYCVRDLNLDLRGDLLLESVVDEEFGDANGTLACRLRGYNPDAAIVPEPNNMVISRAHRGGQQFRLHTSAASIGMGYDGTVLPDPISALGHIIVGLQDLNAEINVRAQRVSSGDAWLSLMPFVLSAGDVLPWGTNESVPESASIEFWIEVPAGVTREDLHTDIRSMVERCTRTAPALKRVSWHMEETKRFIPGSSVPDDSPILRVLGDCFALAADQIPVFANAPFACDAFMFNLYSPTPCVLLGPRGGNAHARDEWVDLEDLVTLTKVFALTILSWLGYEAADGR